MKKIQKLSRWGKYSICFTIPKDFVEKLNLDENSIVQCEMKNGGVFIKEVTINE